MTDAYLYLRTSSDDGADKAGIPGQRLDCTAFAERAGYRVVQEFVDDGISGKTFHMHARPAGRLLIAALLGNGVKTVICDKGSRIGRQQPTFWSFIAMARDNSITVLDAKGTNLCESVQGGMNAIMAEMEYDQTVSRLARGKASWREGGNMAVLHGPRRTDGRWPYGQHPDHKYDAEREIVARIKADHAAGLSIYRITKDLNLEGLRTRYKNADGTFKKFCQSSVGIILHGRKDGYKQPL